MDKSDIKNKCRKVYLHVTNNAIFGDGQQPAQGEYQFVSAFRDKDHADANLKYRIDDDNRYWNNPDVYGRPRHPRLKREVVAFYLVPASKID